MSSDRQPSFTSSSSISRQSTGENNDVTWLDFLRTAGGTAPHDRSSSADRKRRRHAGSSPERRAIPHHPAFTARRLSDRNYGGEAGGSSREQAIDLTSNTRENPIDLTSPSQQRPRMPQRMSSSNENIRANARPPLARPMMGSLRGSSFAAGRRESSDIILPRWQPDSDVSRCPVCQTQFGFWYRKHHCRKCGRVVCAACSPHRITIPRQYIVQPPGSSDGETSPSSPTNGPYPRYLGGGDVVRVCNPCVPDPWTPDTATDGGARGSGGEQGARENANSLPRPERYRPVPPLPPFEHNRTRSQPGHTVQPSSIFSRSVPQGQTSPNFVFRPPPPPPPQNQSRSQAIRNLRTTYTLPGSQDLPGLPSTRPQPPPPPPSAPPQPRQRREIREEDECPVCGNELPPGDSLREAHVQECIALRFSGTPSSSAPTVPVRSSSTSAPTSTSVAIPPSTPTSRSSAVQAASTAQAQTTDPSRPRATSFRPRGMAVYRATEKDCITEDGDAQECVICFEEFQPGDEMGRMECLCKFHRTCIRSWWDTKGTGSCPTHMLHE